VRADVKLAAWLYAATFQSFERLVITCLSNMIIIPAALPAVQPGFRPLLPPLYRLPEIGVRLLGERLGHVTNDI
jgi:hypothetical protein